MIDKLAFSKFWQRQGRWSEVESFKNQGIHDARASGLRGDAAKDAGWEKAFAAFPLPSPADPALPSPASMEQPDDGWHGTAKDWAAEWFGCVRWLAEWQRKHDVAMTDDALRELLDMLGFGKAWAWLQGANGNKPPDSAGKSDLCIAAAIDCYFDDAAEVLTVERLAELAAESPPPG
jgi:hypothetical protein